MVENAVFGINALPVNSGTFCTISPRTLMTGTTIYFNKNYKIEFGAYNEAHGKTFPRNSTQSCTEPDICLGPTGNLKGYYWFLNLRTGLRIKRRPFTPLPTPVHVIDCVHDLTKYENQNPPLNFYDCLGGPLENEDTPDDDGGSL